MKRKLWIDIETFCDIDLRRVSPYVYTESPFFEIMMASWADDPEAPVQVTLGEDAIREIPGLWSPNVIKVAHNAPFERICFSRLRGLPTGEYLDPKQFLDIQALVAELGYMQKLEKVARQLEVSEKDTAGTLLINWFCKPDRHGRRRRPEDHPEKWAAFVEYCRQDTVTMRELDLLVGGDWRSERERVINWADQRINDRGFKVDVATVQRAAQAVAQNNRQHTRDIIRLTGVDVPGNSAKMVAWAQSQGLKIHNMQAETVEQVLAHPKVPEHVKEVFQLHQYRAGTATKKFASALEQISEDGRMRGGFQFFGAHTGRWSGRRVQPHNFPRDSFVKLDPVTGKWVWDRAAEQAAIADLAMGFGLDSASLKKLLRAIIVLDGAVADYASIEAGVVAWHSGETWVLDALRAKRDIYVETAERMGGLTRAQGKIAVLALGFQGSVGSLRAMGAEGTDDELRLLVSRWRKANPHTVDLWYELDSVFWTGGKVGDHLEVVKEGNDRVIVLPSGRGIGYRNVRRRRDSKNRWRMAFFSPQDGGRYVDTYGGRLTENVTQATARDVMAEALVRLEQNGFEPVLHVHDEIGCQNTDRLEEMERLMTIPPSWAEGLPISVEGFLTERYRKG